MRSNKASGTRPEVLLARLLRKRLAKTALPGRPDFVYHRTRLVVFVHGCFWHRCPVDNLPLPKTNTEFWRRKFARNVERDRLNREELQSLGWKVLEVWEHEVKKNPAGVAKRIRSLSRASFK